MTRLESKFITLKTAGKKALITFISAGDPDYETSLEILKGLPAAGADIIELGMPFSDPMAEGPPIQKSSQRALLGGQNMHKTLEMVRAFREGDTETPIILMGYYNPIYKYKFAFPSPLRGEVGLRSKLDEGETKENPSPASSKHPLPQGEREESGVAQFILDAKTAGVDGLIVVDLPPEMDDELCIPATREGLHFIRLVTPTCDAARLQLILNHASGFLYYVSITGITGTQTPDFAKVEKAIAPIRAVTNLPIAVGFGVKTAQDAKTVSSFADAVVVGSALVSAIEKSLDKEGSATDATKKAVHSLVFALNKGME